MIAAPETAAKRLHPPKQSVGTRSHTPLYVSVARQLPERYAVAGLIGLVTAPIFSIIDFSQIAKGRQTGRGLAIGGLVLTGIWLAFGVLLLVGALLAPGG